MPAPVTASRSTSGTIPVAHVIERVKQRGGLTTAEIAQIVGVGPRQVQNWAAGHGGPASKKRLHQLLDLQYVLDLATEIFDDEGAVLWLHARNRQLNSNRPIDLIAEEDAEAVIDLLDRLADGNF